MIRIRLLLIKGKGESLPLAYVQVRAEYLAHAGLAGVLPDLTRVLNTVAKVRGDLVVSRADLAVDFVPPCPMDSWLVRSWITRARDIEPHYRNQVLTGWSIGKGSIMSGRLYDKLCEIAQKSNAVYLFGLWRERGWNVAEPVWRLEGQFRREVLEQLGIQSPESLSDRLQGLWTYFAEDWLRLAIPTADHNPSRWPTHPFWTAIAGASWGQDDQPRLKRFRKQRIPPDDKLYPMVMGYIASFMAREQIDDFGEGIGELLRRMRGYVDIEGGRFGKAFESLLQDKIKAKGRLYNTLDNTRTDAKSVADAAQAYRRAKGIEDANL